MKKLGILLALCLVVTLVFITVGCGGGGEATPTPILTSTPTAQVTGTPSSTATTTPEAAVLTLGQLTAKALDIGHVKYDVKETQPGGKTTTSTAWVKFYSGNEVAGRIETVQNGQKQIMIINDQVMFFYDPQQNTAMRLPFSISGAMAMAQELEAEFHPTYIRTETVDSKVCLVYEYATTVMDITVTTDTWYWKDKGLPVKMESISPEGKTTWEYKNFNFSDFSDSLIQLPAGVQIVDMGQETGWGGGD